MSIRAITAPRSQDVCYNGHLTVRTIDYDRIVPLWSDMACITKMVNPIPIDTTGIIPTFYTENANLILEYYDQNRILRHTVKAPKDEPTLASLTLEESDGRFIGEYNPQFGDGLGGNIIIQLPETVDPQIFPISVISWNTTHNVRRYPNDSVFTTGHSGELPINSVIQFTSDTLPQSSDRLRKGQFAFLRFNAASEQMQFGIISTGMDPTVAPSIIQNIEVTVLGMNPFNTNCNILGAEFDDSIGNTVTFLTTNFSSLTSPVRHVGQLVTDNNAKHLGQIIAINGDEYTIRTVMRGLDAATILQINTNQWTSPTVNTTTNWGEYNPADTSTQILELDSLQMLTYNNGQWIRDTVNYQQFNPITGSRTWNLPDAPLVITRKYYSGGDMVVATYTGHLPGDLILGQTRLVTADGTQIGIIDPCVPATLDISALLNDVSKLYAHSRTPDAMLGSWTDDTDFVIYDPAQTTTNQVVHLSGIQCARWSNVANGWVIDEQKLPYQPLSGDVLWRNDGPWMRQVVYNADGTAYVPPGPPDVENTDGRIQWNGVTGTAYRPVDGNPDSMIDDVRPLVLPNAPLTVSLPDGTVLGTYSGTAPSNIVVPITIDTMANLNIQSMAGSVPDYNYDGSAPVNVPVAPLSWQEDSGTPAKLYDPLDNGANALLYSNSLTFHSARTNANTVFHPTRMIPTAAFTQNIPDQLLRFYNWNGNVVTTYDPNASTLCTYQPMPNVFAATLPIADYSNALWNMPAGPPAASVATLGFIAQTITINSILVPLNLVIPLSNLTPVTGNFTAYVPLANGSYYIFRYTPGSPGFELTDAAYNRLGFGVPNLTFYLVL